MRGSTAQTILLNGRSLDYRLVESATAKHLRVRVRPEIVEVLKPKDRTKADVQKFLRDKEAWIASQVDRVKKLNGVRKTVTTPANTMLLRGERVRLTVQRERNAGINRIKLSDGGLTIHAGTECRTPVQTSLTNWLRRQAREEIMRLLPEVCRRLRRSPNKVFVMGQRTKWGNCSAKKTLSFNWRLIMAPPHVLRYIITHEVVHLAVPDHSTRFWLTVQSHCPDAERARQWLAAHGSSLFDAVGANEKKKTLTFPQTTASLPRG